MAGSGRDHGAEAGLEPPRQLSAPRQALFFGITVATPVIVLVAAEGLLRLAVPGGGLPLFRPFAPAPAQYVAPNPRVASRWFARDATPPSPMPEAFARSKPERGLRIFALGESSAAGFPYPRNVAFSRLVRDFLRDALPEDSVEVINLGIAATNSFAMLDIADEVADQRPDAVLIYAGHNEYYGALGAASAESVLGGSGLVVRAYLRVLDFRLGLALRDAITRVGRALGTAAGPGTDEASRMEALARDREVPLAGRTYRRGARQFEENLGTLVGRFRRRGIPVFVGSLASNLRDQPPFASRANAAPQGAGAVFEQARAALAGGATARARSLFARARDLDVVRFRAPGEFNEIVRRVAAAGGATYVPVEEAFVAASPGGIPGVELFLEHVHPNRRGYALLGRVFAEAIRDAEFLGRLARPESLRSWEAYERGMELTPFDERIALHTTRTLTGRWPFVPLERQTDYRAVYRPRDRLDSLALLVSRGLPWESGKLQLAASYEARGLVDSAVAEYRGLARDAPLFEEPLRLQGRALLAAGREADADSVLRRALRLRPTAYTTYALGVMALRRRDFPDAISLLRHSLSLSPDESAALYQLSLAYGLSRDLPNARATALRLLQVNPRYPGLDGWLKALGLRP